MIRCWSISDLELTDTTEEYKVHISGINVMAI